MVESTKIRVFGTKGAGVVVTGATTAQVRKAMASLTKKTRAGSMPDDTKVALKLHRVLKKFFRTGGRFKKHYKKKVKTA